MLWSTALSAGPKAGYFISADLPDTMILVHAARSLPQSFHIFAHGRPGQLWLDGQWMDAPAIARKFDRIRQPLAIWGCEFGKGEKGRQAVGYLARILGVPVSASDDRTGTGGDWLLEVGPERSLSGMDSYRANLQCPAAASTGDPDTDGDGILDSQDLDDDNDGIPDSVEMRLSCSSSTLSGTWTKNGTSASYTFPNGVVVKATATLPAGANSFVDGNFNNPATSFWSLATLKGARSLQADYKWNTTLTLKFENAAGSPVFVHQPVIHWDRIGGNSSTPLQTSPRITLQNGLTWFALASPGTQTGFGTLDFQVTATTVQDAGAGSATNSNYNAESGDNNASSSAAGSVQLNQTVSQISMTFPAASAIGNVTIDAIELILSNICPVADSDGDGIPDHRDLDSDNDGIPDAIEGCGNTSVSLDASCRVTYNATTDVDGADAGTCKDGLPVSTCTTPADNDGDSTPDYLDTDSDNDGCADYKEAGLSAAPVYASDATGLTGAGCFKPANTNWINASASPVCTPPAATDDASSGNTPNTNVSVSILTNDKRSDGTQATTSNTSVALTTTGLPAGSSLAGNTVTVPGEGTWTYDPATGNLTFDPQTGFIGSPATLSYVLTETATGLSDNAAVSIAYKPMPPVASDDRGAADVTGSNVTIAILANDSLAAGTPASTATTSVTLTTTGLPNGSTLLDNTVSVPGQGSWTYNPATGEIIFDPETGFNDDPTPLTYTLTQTSTGLTDNATVSVHYLAKLPDLFPDLTPSQFFTSLQIKSGQSVDYVVGISNVGPTATSGPIEFFVTRFGSATGLSMTLKTASSVDIDGEIFNLENDAFTVTQETTRFRFVSKPGIVIPSLGVKFIGFAISRSGGTNGTLNNTVTITNATGGGETPTDNNAIANPLTKIP